MKKFALSSLLKLQLLYCALGVGYNVVSYIRAATGARALAATPPVTGAIFMLVYGLCLFTGYKGMYKVYRALMAFFVIVTGYSGIIKHFIVYAQQPDAYSSQLAWASAIGINIFGALLNLAAVVGWFDSKPE